MTDSRETFSAQAFVAGYPIKHSRSPLIHGYWLKAYGIAGAYETVEIKPENFPAFMAQLRNGESGYRGGNVTIPHKEAAAHLADHVDEIAREIGAANTLWREDGRILATNTDSYGFAANLDQQQPGWDRASTAVVLGAGGASRAIIQAVRDRGIKDIRIVNRTVERAQELADRFGETVSAHGMAALQEVLEGCDLFINTTSLGMKGEPFPAIAWDRFPSHAVVTDIVYVPLRTEMLRQAEQAGLATVDGLGMLLHQAVPGFEKWFGRRPVITPDLRQLIEADLEAHG
ncbi:shikimate dehydrogenase [Rhizobium paknamense]|uniref:Shikimate dehydrogenase (NADP(+)) n=1 Tax=Rhizobium paknamense TaxID=1206817 RepID=A0ABU0II65_9HYPH|nr:shikimate dehydrogenase [Rhizobium paknamense]MDQ0457948.1 shikimate dehydrogenase [Rhizobium paknamense]